MKNKNVKKIQWDEQGMKQFKGFLKQMFGEYGNVKFDSELYDHYTDITVSQSTGEQAKIEATFKID